MGGGVLGSTPAAVMWLVRSGRRRSRQRWPRKGAWFHFSCAFTIENRSSQGGGILRSLTYQMRGPVVTLGTL